MNNNEILDVYSYWLFRKLYSELNWGERYKFEEFLHDLEYPKWKNIIINNQDTGYKISNIGVVIGKKGNIIKQDISNTGYYTINGYTNKKPIHLRVHREVAKAFIPNIENKAFVNHLNGNKKCNWVGNLEWATHEENMEHAVRIGLIDMKGIKHPENVYTEEQIRKACKLLEDPKNGIEYICRETGINRSILYSIRMGRSWTHISKEYKIDKPIEMKQFTDEQIERAAKLLGETNLSYNKISIITEVPIRTLVKIVHQSPKYKTIAIQYNVPKERDIRKSCIKE